MSDTSGFSLSRRGFLSAMGAVGASAALSGCISVPGQQRIVYRDGYAPDSGPLERPLSFAPYEVTYGSVIDDGYEIPAVPIERVDPVYYRQYVADPTGEAPGTIVVDTGSHFLYLVQPGGRALRYGVGLGREGFAWSGRAVVQWKQKWPRWKVPAEMIARQPELAKYSVEAGGMEPGLNNPLGARALYIFQNGEDTLYRLHGSPEWNSIGRNVSSGCVRLMNQDIIDLYERVPNRTPILVGSGFGVS